MKLDLAIEPNMNQLAALSERLEQTLVDEGVQAHRVGQVRLIVEELASNAIVHGECTQLSVCMRMDPGELVLEFNDAGRAFDPTANADPDLDAPLDARPIGGLGLFMVRQLADRVDYRRDAGCNIVCVTLLRPFAPETESLP